MDIPQAASVVKDETIISRFTICA